MRSVISFNGPIDMLDEFIRGTGDSSHIVVNIIQWLHFPSNVHFRYRRFGWRREVRIVE